jgi:hypothetical protein
LPLASDGRDGDDLDPVPLARRKKVDQTIDALAEDVLAAADAKVARRLAR